MRDIHGDMKMSMHMALLCNIVLASNSCCYVRSPIFYVQNADRATNLDIVLSNKLAADGVVFSEGLHCKKEQPGFVLIENGCPGSVVLSFKVLFC
jgi:hypothetical protein